MNQIIFGSVTDKKVEYYAPKSDLLVNFCDTLHSDTKSDDKVHFRVEYGILSPVGNVRIKTSQKSWLTRAAKYLKTKGAEISVVIAHLEKGVIYASSIK